MNTINIVFIAGIRSQFIKLASIQKAMKQFNISSDTKINPIYINSGQHYSTELIQFISELKVNFDFTFQYEKKDPLILLSQMQIKLYECIKLLEKKQEIDWITVFGDANTTLAGSIVASRLNIPLIHIEAGVRTGDRSSHEEINRIVADNIAKIHFTSSKKDIVNLKKENLGKFVYFSGDIIYDLIKEFDSTLKVGYEKYKNGFILCTIHRQENLDSISTIRKILDVLYNYQRQTIFITHPRTEQLIRKIKNEYDDKIHFKKGIPYLTLLKAIKSCAFVVTDSGALQRETFYLKKRCLLRQDVAFWKSLVDSGIHATFKNSKSDFLAKLNWIEKMIKQPYPNFTDFGNGNASLTILKKISEL
ncbi:MAG: UDP-N-acetylglucosamine 2-epimerase [Balneola sp.]